MRAGSPVTPENISNLRRMLPKRIELSYNTQDDLLTVTIPSPNLGIRSDCGAFEGWVLLLHEHLLGHRILLDVSLPAQVGDTQHTRQFFYRAYQFSLLVYDWFSLSTNLSELVSQFLEIYRMRPKYFAVPGRSNPRGDHGENILISRFCSDESLLYAMPECEGAQLYPRLPTELFWGESSRDISAANRIFPLSANERIDLWCLKGTALNLFLLKYQSPKMSMLSELFCYSCLLRDSFLSPEENGIRLPTVRDGSLAPFFDETGELRPLTQVDAWFLADSYHRLFEPVYLCDMTTTKQIRFHSLTYNCDMPVSFQAN